MLDVFSDFSLLSFGDLSPETMAVAVEVEEELDDECGGGGGGGGGGGLITAVAVEVEVDVASWGRADFLIFEFTLDC